MSMDNKEFLQWIHDRLQFVHGDKESYDYMHKLRSIIASTESDNITQAAATKASEEGGLRAASLDSYSTEDCAFYEFWYGHMLDDLMQPPLIGISHSTARYIWDAASRQVANKADVELDAGFLQWVHDRMRFVHGEDENVDYMHKLRAIIASVPPGRNTPNVASIATPPATTGASTVLTDERLYKLWAQVWNGNADINLPLTYGRLVEREVAAQAGQVAVPAWISCKDAVPEVGQVVLVACEGWDTPAVLKYQVQPYQRFIDQSSGRWWWHHEAMSWMHLPASPAKESK